MNTIGWETGMNSGSLGGRNIELKDGMKKSGRVFIDEQDLIEIRNMFAGPLRR